MKIIKSNNFTRVFPMRITCRQVKDVYGFAYGEEKDFCGSELEIDAEDIKYHKWFKYPDYEGTDYGVVCPVCGKFIVVDKRTIPYKVLGDAEEILLSAVRRRS